MKKVLNQWCLYTFIKASIIALYTFRPAAVNPIVTCCRKQIVFKHLLSCFGSCSILFVGFRCSYKMIELILSVVFLPGGPLRGKLSLPDFSSLITCFIFKYLTALHHQESGGSCFLSIFLIFPSDLLHSLYSPLVRVMATLYLLWPLFP